MKLIESKRILSSKFKNNSRRIVSLDSKDRILSKIDRSNLLEFLIESKSKIIFCCCYNIVTKSLFNLVFTKFKNLPIVFAILNYVNNIINKYIFLF